MARFTHWIILSLPVLVLACVPAYDLSSHPDNSFEDSLDSGEGDSEVVLYGDVLIIDDDPCVTSVDVPEDREELTFTFSCDPIGRGLEPGTIVVGSVGGGYLRRVLSIAIDGYVVTAWTEEASLSEVIEEGGFSEDIVFGDDARATLDFSGTTIYHGDVGPTELKIRLDKATFELDPALEIDGHWEDGKIQRLNFDLGIDIGAELKVTVESTDGLRIGRDIPLWTHNYPFAFAIGPLPVVGVLETKLVVGARVDADGKVEMTTGAGGSLKLHNRKEYTDDGGWVDADVSEGSWHLELPDFNIAKKAKVSAYAQVDLHMKLYGVAGPHFRQRLALTAAGDIHCEGIEYELGAAVTSRGSIKFKIFDKIDLNHIFMKVTFTADLLDGIIPWPIDSPIPCDNNPIVCGQTVQGDTRQNLSPLLDGYSCNIGNYEAPEIIYEWKATQDGPVIWELIDPEPSVLNHDLFVIDGMWNLVVGDCIGFGFNEMEFEAEAGNTYYLVVDGFHQDSGSFTAKLTCDDANPFADNSADPF